MAAKTTNVATCKVNRVDSQNVEITFPDTDENTEALIAFANTSGWNVRILTPRNPYGAKGMPKDVKRDKLLALLAELEAAE